MEAYQQLEQDWAEFNDLDPAGMVACSSGTAALHLSLEALRLPPGSGVVTSDFNMIAVPRAIVLAGLTPVFVDCNNRLLMDTELFDKALGFNVTAQAAVITHIYGRRCDMDRIVHHICIKEFPIVEDLAEAHGVRPHPTTDAACWSFYRNKIVAGEEGGAVWFRDPAHAALARQLRSLGFTGAHDFNHVPRGHNYRMSNAHAELILGSYDTFEGWGNENSLEHFKDNLVRRRAIELVYDAHCPPGWKMPPRDAPWVYDIRVPGMAWAQQDRIVKQLNSEGIAARHAFKPMHAQEEFKNCRIYVPGGHKSSILSQWTMYFPIQPGVTTEAQIKRGFDVVKQIVQS